MNLDKMVNLANLAHHFALLAMPNNAYLVLQDITLSSLHLTEKILTWFSKHWILLVLSLRFAPLVPTIMQHKHYVLPVKQDVPNATILHFAWSLATPIVQIVLLIPPNVLAAHQTASSWWTSMTLKDSSVLAVALKIVMECQSNQVSVNSAAQVVPPATVPITAPLADLV